MGKQWQTDIDDYAGNQIRSRRMELGMSQADLAHFIEVTSQQVQKYESGINRIEPNTLCRIAYALDVPVQYFFEYASVSRSKNPTQSAEAKLRSTPECETFVAALARVKNVELRGHIVQLVETISLDQKSKRPSMSKGQHIRKSQGHSRRRPQI